MQAWHRGIETWRSQPSLLDSTPEEQARAALLRSLHEDAEAQREVGVHDEDQHAEIATHLTSCLEHYIATTESLPLTEQEREIEVPIPSRSGKRGSNRYRLHAFVDGVTEGRNVDGSDRPWLVEFKLRMSSLTPADVVMRSRQVRWYAWAWWQATGVMPGGVLLDERLAEAPKPPRIVAAKRKGEGIEGRVPSHAKEQTTTPEWYAAVCGEYDVEPNPDTVESLTQRKWGQRVPVQLRNAEFAETGQELVSASRLIADLDGVRFPLRNASRATCSGCDFNSICGEPVGPFEPLGFETVPAKRDRKEDDEREQHGVRQAA